VIGPEYIVEESLRQAEDRLQMLRFFSDAIRKLDVVPEPGVFSGLADDLEEIQTIVHAVRRALSADALNTAIGTGRKRKADR
jgi:hypothetical protein